jgi:hypothetical protein
MNQITCEGAGMIDTIGTESEIQELNDLQLAAVGGGIADTIGF